jgi:hypothetical protein
LSRGDFFFIGAGRRPGLKSVLAITQDGSVRRMEVEPMKLKRVPGRNSIDGGPSNIFDIDLDGAELLIPGGS